MRLSQHAYTFHNYAALQYPIILLNQINGAGSGGWWSAPKCHCPGLYEASVWNSGGGLADELWRPAMTALK